MAYISAKYFMSINSSYSLKGLKFANKAKCTNIILAEFLKTYLKTAQNIRTGTCGENFHRELAVLLGLIVKPCP